MRNLVFTHNENWLVTSDAAGQVKYWKLNLELVKVRAGDLAHLALLSINLPSVPPPSSAMHTCMFQRAQRLLQLKMRHFAWSAGSSLWSISPPGYLLGVPLQQSIIMRRADAGPVFVAASQVSHAQCASGSST